MKPKPRGISMVERAIIANQWHQGMVDSKIHALIGDDSNKMVNLAGRMLFVALGAALADNLDPEDPDIRIIRGAVNAVHDQAGESVIPAIRRASIVSGLEAVSRMCQRVQRKSLINAACEMELRLRNGHIHTSDFLRMVPV